MRDDVGKIRIGIYGGFLFFTIIGFANPFFALYAAELGLSTATIGILVTLRSALPILIAVPAGQLIDSVGSVRVLRYSVLMMLASLVIIGLETSVWMLGLSQILYGISLTILVSCFQVLVSSGDKEIRNRYIKKYSMYTAAGTMLGPLIGGYVVTLSVSPVSGYQRLFFLAAAMSVFFFLAVSIAMWRSNTISRPPEGPGDAVSVRRSGLHDSLNLFRIPEIRFGLVTTFLVIYIHAIYLSFVPVFLKDSGYTPLFISVCLAGYGWAGIISRFLIPWLTARLSIPALLTSAGFVGAMAILSIPLTSLEPAILAFVLFLMGGAIGLNLPVGIMFMVNVINERDRGKMMGMRLVFNRSAHVISPAIFGALGQWFGLAMAFYAGGAMLVSMMACFSVYRYRKRR